MDGRTKMKIAGTLPKSKRVHEAELLAPLGHSRATSPLLSIAVRRSLRRQGAALCVGAGLVAGTLCLANAGHASSFPPVLPLRSLHPAQGGDGSEGLLIKGVDALDYASRSISGVGDVNGDAIDDVIIASVGDSNGRTNTGESYVVFGRARFPAAFELGLLFPAAGGDGSKGFVLKGVDAFDYAHYARGAGDVNGDGLNDLIIGARRAERNGTADVGESYVVFGRSTGFPPVIELRRLFPGAGGDGSTGFVVKGISEFDRCGNAVSGAGDVNGDGVDDLLIGAYGAGPYPYSPGQSYVVFGRSTGFPAAFDLRRLLPSQGGDGSEGSFSRASVTPTW